MTSSQRDQSGPTAMGRPPFFAALFGPQPTVWAGLAIVAMTALVYSPLRNAGYIWDDDDYVTQNGNLLSFEGLQKTWLAPRSLPQYYPLVHTTFWVEHKLWGLAPVGFHLVNVALHATSALLLWYLLLRLDVPGAWLAAAIFAVHPVMVESVAWITERKNVLSLTLALLSMHAYLCFAPLRQRTEAETLPNLASRRRWYLLSLVTFAGALGSKTVVATLPAVLLVIFWWKRGRISRRDVIPLLPFFALGISLGMFTVWLERHHVGAQGEEWNFTFVDRILIAGRAAWFYATKLVWPHPLIFFYPRWQIDQRIWWQYLYPLAACGLVLALYAVRPTIGRGPLAAVLIFGGVLFPALGFFDVFPMRYSFVADHFQYHASIALISLIAAGVAMLAARLASTWKPIADALAIAVLAALSLLSYQHMHVFYDQETLYRDTIARNPQCEAAYVNLGTYFGRMGRLKDSLDLASEGLNQFPNNAEMHKILAAALLRLGDRDGFSPGQLDAIILHLNTAITLKPGDASSHTYLGDALLADHRPSEAHEHFRQALAIDPAKSEALLGIGSVLALQGDAAGAEDYFSRAVSQNPDSARAHYSLAILLLDGPRSDEAVGHLQTALRINPRLPEAHYALAGALIPRGDLRGAADHYAKAIELRPAFDRALNNLGIVLMNLGETQKAIECFEAAVRSNPDYAEAKKNLANARTVKEQSAPGSIPQK